MENEVAQRRIINTCNTCRMPIYEGEPIYRSEVGKNTGTNAGLYGGYGGKVPIIPGEGIHAGSYGGLHSDDQSSEIWVQCAWCYDQWQAELAKSKWFWPKWLLGCLPVGIIAALVFNFWYPSLKRNTLDFNDAFFPRKIYANWQLFSAGSWISLLLVFLVGIVLGRIFRPRVDRYKLREKEKE
jgi:hypothetical protein